MPKEMAQFQVITEPERLYRLDALRVVLGVSRAKVVNMAMDRGLSKLEREHEERLNRLHDLGAGMNGGWVTIVKEYAERNRRKTYGETLEELEGAAGHE